MSSFDGVISNRALNQFKATLGLAGIFAMFLYLALFVFVLQEEHVLLVMGAPIVTVLGFVSAINRQASRKRLVLASVDQGAMPWRQVAVMLGIAVPLSFWAGIGAIISACINECDKLRS